MLTESKLDKMFNELSHTTSNGGFIDYNLEMEAAKAIHKLRQAFRDKRIQEERIKEASQSYDG
jgi:hypothetical protein